MTFTTQAVEQQAWGNIYGHVSRFLVLTRLESWIVLIITFPAKVSIYGYAFSWLFRSSIHDHK